MSHIFPLIVTVETESISVHTIGGVEVCHWVEDEWLEDPTITPAIVNAVHLAHTEPDLLLRLNANHIYPQIPGLKRSAL